MGAQFVKDLGQSGFSDRLTGDGLELRLGPFNAHIQAPIPDLLETLFSFYADYPLLAGDQVFSFRARIEPGRPLFRRYKPLVRFLVDDLVPHADLPADQALPVLEWGINLVIALRSHCFLMLHSAVLERGGHTMLLPAAPGFGKTTLCAALAHRGWRLLSDEFGLIRPNTKDFVPVPRPMALKNESIEVFRSFAPEATIGPSIANTRKGTVAHVKPPMESVLQQHSVAPAKLVVFPRWQAGAGLSLEPLSKSDGFMMIAMNAFNYELLGEAAFTTVRDLLATADCYRLVYSNLDEAIARLTGLMDGDG